MLTMQELMTIVQKGLEIQKINSADGNLFSPETICCTGCNARLQEQLFATTFYITLSALFLIVVVLTLILILLTWIFKRKIQRLLRFNSALRNPLPVMKASVILGIGIGGFIDGVLLHQVIQWHEMVSNRLSPVTLETKSINMFWDGIFHLLMLVAVLIGVITLFNALHDARNDTSKKLLYSGLLIGWGLFNVVEGLIDHQLFRLHFVKQIATNPSLYNYGFLFFSIALIAIGYLLIPKPFRSLS